MKQKQFERLYAAEWQQFEQILEDAEKKQLDNPEKFLVLYRRICHLQSIAKTRLYNLSLCRRFDELVQRGHNVLYRKKLLFWNSVLTFYALTFPRLVREECWLVLISSLLFLGPGIFIIIAILVEPDLAYNVMGYEGAKGLENMYDPSEAIIGEARESSSNWMMFGFYIKNNIGIAFNMFATGVFATIGSLFFLIYNGIFIGAATGHIINTGYIDTFFTFVIAHGSVELIGLVLAGVAGLRLGLAMLTPGNLTRIEALRRSGFKAIQMMFGVFTFLLIAAFVEAFWSSNNVLPYSAKYMVGALCWALVLFYLGFAGRRKMNRQ